MFYILGNLTKKYFHVFFLIIFIIVKPLLLDEDIESYYLNLLDLNQQVSLNKFFWYTFIFLPLRLVFNDPVFLIKVFQCLLSLFFLFLIHRNSNISNLYLRVFLIFIFLFIPFMHDFYSQYLRESTAFLFFILSISLRNKIPIFLILIISVLCHYIAIFWIVAYYFSLFLINRYKSSIILSVIYSIFFIVALSLCSLNYLDIISVKSFFPETISYYLTGSRANFFGIIYLVAYIVYLLLNFFSYKLVFHSAALLLLFVNLSMYMEILDYGRSFHAPAILHLFASLRLYSEKGYVSDMIICCCFSLVFYLI